MGAYKHLTTVNLTQAKESLAQATGVSRSSEKLSLKRD